MKILEKISCVIINRSSKILFLILFLSCIFAYYAFFSERRLEVDFSLEQMFPNDDISKKIYDNFLEDFSREDNLILLTYSGKEYDPLNLKEIEQISYLVEDFELIDGIESVISIPNLIDDFIDYEKFSKSDLDNFLDQNIFRNSVISQNHLIGGILINLDESIQGQNSRSNVFREIDKIIDNTNLIWHEAGIPVLRTRYVELVSKERNVFFPLSTIVVIIILYAVFRQIKCIILPIIGIGIGLIWVSAIMALGEISINVITYLTFNLLMIIGCSNAIHILVKYHEVLSKNSNKLLSLQCVISEIGGALFLTSFTTAVGFLSLTLTNIRIMQEFGFIVGIGVFIMFIMNIIILPILLLYVDVPDKSNIDRLIKQGTFSSLFKFDNFLNKNKFQIILVALFLFIFSLIGLNKIDYKISILDDLKEGNELFDNIKFVENNLGGTLPLEIIIDTNIKDGALVPEFLNKIDSLSSQIGSFENVGTSISIADHLKFINEYIMDEDKSIPRDKDVIKSYLIGYEQTDKFFDLEFSKSRIMVRIKNINSLQAEDLVYKIKDMSKTIFGKNVIITATGSTLLALSTSKNLVKSLTTSFSIAFIIIFISMIFLFRSVRISLISIFPNMIPILVAGGLMGYLGIKLRPSTAMTFSIALGIAVDDTIHFLARYRQECLRGLSSNQSISRTVQTTGKAILSTTIVLALGFMVMIFSEFVPNYEFGILATIILIIALSGSLVLLPALLMIVKPSFKFGNRS